MMKLTLAFVLILPFTAQALELKVGDILLQPLNCWTCKLIEEQENSIYSHMAMVIETEPTVKVIESLGAVRVTTLQEFNARTKKAHKLSVRRFRNDRVLQYIQDNKEQLVHDFTVKFEGLKFDSEFLWDNFSDDGNEKLYCSEMITKLLGGFLNIKLPIKRMKYDKNRELWIQHFRGNPPDGRWGNAPADYEKSDLFYAVGEL